MKFQNKIAASGALALLLTACAPAGTPAAVAPSSGELVVYTSRSEALIKPAVQAFNVAYPGIKVTVLTGKVGELAAKIAEEANAPKADVLINTDTLIMASMAASGAFQPNASASVMGVPERYRAADGAWTTLTLRPRVIIYNTTLVKPEELPNSVLQLTNAKWKGQVGAADSTNGAMMAHIAALRKLEGSDKAEAFVSGLVANETQFFGGHTDVRKAVGAGELKLGLVNHYYYHLSKAEGAPVGVIYPDQDSYGLLVNSTNAGIVKGAPHAAQAALFVDFLLSKEGQKVFAEVNFEYPIVEGVALAKDVPPLSNFKLAEVSFKALSDERAAAAAMAQKAGLP